MSLILIWPEGLPSHSFNFSHMDTMKIDTENFLLSGLELINRAVVLSGGLYQTSPPFWIITHPAVVL